MIAFIVGKVYSYGKDYVVVENNGVGYYLNFSRPEKISLGQELMFHTYQHVREDDISLFGFLTPEEKILFMNLISVKGVGPKSAIAILGASPTSELVNAIELGDVGFLKRMPGIGAKTASQIILDLKGKLVEEQNDSNYKSIAFDEAIAALKSLGYKTNEIQTITKELAAHQDLTTDEYIKTGLQLLLKRKGM